MALYPDHADDIEGGAGCPGHRHVDGLKDSQRKSGGPGKCSSNRFKPPHNLHQTLGYDSKHTGLARDLKTSLREHVAYLLVRVARTDVTSILSIRNPIAVNWPSMLERSGQDQPTAAFQKARKIGEQLSIVQYMLDYLGTDDLIEFPEIF